MVSLKILQHVDLIDPNFDTHGQYTRRAINTLSSLADIQHRSLMATSSPMPITQAHKHDVKSETPDYDKYRPYFGWVNTDTIWDTFKNTTHTYPMKRHLISRNPPLNVPRKYVANVEI